MLLACAAAARPMAAAAVGGLAPTRRLRPRGNPAGACPGDPAGASANNSTATDRATGCAHDASGPDTGTADGHHATAPTDTGATDGDYATTADIRAADAGPANRDHAAPTYACTTHRHDSTTADAGPADGNYAATTHTRPTHRDHTTTNARAAHGDQSAGTDRLPLQGRRTEPHAGRLRALGRARCAGDDD